MLAADEAREQLVVCIDRDAARCSARTPTWPFFDENGEPTDYTKSCIQFCNDFETEGRRTEAFVNLLKELDLFETRKQPTFTPDQPGRHAGPSRSRSPSTSPSRRRS